MFWHRKPPQAIADPRKPSLRCSFCNKTQRDIRRLIAGPGVNICDDCVEICVTTLREACVSERSITSAPPAALYCSVCSLAKSWLEGSRIPDRGFVCGACIAIIAAHATVPHE